MARHRLNEDDDTTILSTEASEPDAFWGSPEPDRHLGPAPRSRRLLIAIGAIGAVCAVLIGMAGFARYRPDTGVVWSIPFTYSWSPGVPTLSPTGSPTAAATGSPAPSATPSGSRASTTPTTPVPSSTPSTGPTATEDPPLTSLPTGVTRSFRSVASPTQYVRAVSTVANLSVIDTGSSTARQEATFTIVSGLADAACYSFVATGGAYLRHRNFRLRVDSNDGSNLFRQDATFCVRPGSAGGSMMLEATNYPGYYIHPRGDELWLDSDQNTAAFRADCSLRPGSPLS